MNDDHLSHLFAAARRAESRLQFPRSEFAFPTRVTALAAAARPDHSPLLRFRWWLSAAASSAAVLGLVSLLSASSRESLEHEEALSIFWDSGATIWNDSIFTPPTP
jgi:hypothetical protein